MKIQDLIDCYNNLMSSRHRSIATPYYDEDGIFECVSKDAFEIDTTDTIIRAKAFKYNKHPINLKISKLLKITVDPFNFTYSITPFDKGELFSKYAWIAIQDVNGAMFGISPEKITMNLSLKPKKYVTN